MHAAWVCAAACQGVCRRAANPEKPLAEFGRRAQCSVVWLSRATEVLACRPHNAGARRGSGKDLKCCRNAEPLRTAHEACEVLVRESWTRFLLYGMGRARDTRQQSALASRVVSVLSPGGSYRRCSLGSRPWDLAKGSTVGGHPVGFAPNTRRGRVVWVLAAGLVHCMCCANNTTR
jgi:hypothetical protein